MQTTSTRRTFRVTLLLSTTQAVLKLPNTYSAQSSGAIAFAEMGLYIGVIGGAGYILHMMDAEVN